MYVGCLANLERLDFPQLHALFPSVELLLHLLNGCDLLGLAVDGLEDAAVRAVAQLFRHLVSVHL